MSEAKHTPGPWQACDVGDYSDYDGRCRVILGNDLRIAVVLGDHDESAANARLIAAAPDLLEELEDMVSLVEYLMNDSYDNKETAEARAAIAKAKGDQR